MASSRATFYALKANIRGGGYEGDKDSLVELFNQTQKPKEYLLSSTPKAWVGIHPDDFGDRFNLREEELYAYLGGFVKTYLEKVNTVIPQLGNDEEDLRDLLNGSASDDNDIKLSLYRSFKSIYDKWISSSDRGIIKKPFYNADKDNTKNRLLFDHFSFVNRGFSDIGSEAVIDPTYILKMAEEPTMTLYQLITEVLSKNNFDFFPLPGYINYQQSEEDGISDEDLKDMFRPIDDLEDIEASPSFICMYVGGSSRTLDIKNLASDCTNGKLSFEYEDDSFAVDEDFDLPPEVVGGGGITAFKVAYGAENQSHFSNLTIDQSEFKETQESLAVIDQLVNPKEGSGPSKATKGNNLYDVYLTRSYKCSVETLGNMMIQPLMYFKLENVPMFHGTYLITDVKHTIKPHNVKTTFTGVRQPLVSIPIVKDPISIFNLSINDVQDDETKITDLSRGRGKNNQAYGSDGEDWIPNKEKVDLSKIGSGSGEIVRIHWKGNGVSGSPGKTAGVGCRAPGSGLRGLPHYTANDEFDVVGTKMTVDQFAKGIDEIKGLSNLEKRVIMAVALREQGNGDTINCFGNNCFGFNVEGNFNGMDQLVSDGKVLNTFCWVDSGNVPRVFPQFSNFKDSVKIFAENQVKSRWFEMTFYDYRGWNGNAPYQQTLANASPELNLFGTDPSGSQRNGIKESDTDEVQAAKFVIAYYWNWNSNTNKGDRVASIESLENPKVTSNTKSTFDSWNRAGRYFG